MTATIALSTWLCKYPDDIVGLTRSTGVKAVEWDLNYIPLPLSDKRRRSIAREHQRAGLHIRYHLPYSSCDIGHVSEPIRRVSLSFLKHNIDLVASLGGTVAILHYGTSGNNDGLAELQDLVSFARSRGIRILVENCLDGTTKIASRLLQIAETLDCGIALDTGHAGRGKTGSAFEQFVKTLAERVEHVHLYGRETTTRDHVPFRAEADMLRVVKCVQAYARPDWWTCEMDRRDEALKQYHALTRFLGAE